MRLFTAIEIERAVMLQVSRLIDDLRARVATQAPVARITWVPAERLHLTIQFIGHVDAAKGERILQALKPALDLRPFALQIEATGAFPGGGAPRVIWAGVGGDLDSLAALAETVAARLQACGIEREEREFRPHLTLARVREAAGLRARVLLDGVTTLQLGTFTVDAITLFESRLSPKGPTYVALQRTPLVWQP